MRLNARLSDDLASKLDALQQATHRTASEVVRAAIERYFEEICRPAHSSRDAILASGLVACGDGDADLATTYKPHIHAFVAQKHDHR